MKPTHHIAIHGVLLWIAISLLAWNQYEFQTQKPFRQSTVNEVDQNEEQKMAEIRHLTSDVQFIAKMATVKKSISESESKELKEKLARLAELGVTSDLQMTPR